MKGKLRTKSWIEMITRHRVLFFSKDDSNVFHQLFLHAFALTGIWDFEPGRCRQDPLACVRAGVEAVLVDLRWENIGHSKNEAQQPGDQDGHDDLGAEQDTRQDS